MRTTSETHLTGAEEPVWLRRERSVQKIKILATVGALVSHNASC